MTAVSFVNQWKLLQISCHLNYFRYTLLRSLMYFEKGRISFRPIVFKIGQKLLSVCKNVTKFIGNVQGEAFGSKLVRLLSKVVIPRIKYGVNSSRNPGFLLCRFWIPVFTPARWSAMARKHGNDKKEGYGIYGQTLNGRTKLSWKRCVFNSHLAFSFISVRNGNPPSNFLFSTNASFLLLIFVWFHIE